MDLTFLLKEDKEESNHSNLDIAKKEEGKEVLRKDLFVFLRSNLAIHPPSTVSITPQMKSEAGESAGKRILPDFTAFFRR